MSAELPQPMVPAEVDLRGWRPRRNGGSHHPSNLQCLCDPCNARKAGLVDSKGRPQCHARAT